MGAMTAFSGDWLAASRSSVFSEAQEQAHASATSGTRTSRPHRDPGFINPTSSQSAPPIQAASSSSSGSHFHFSPGHQKRYSQYSLARTLSQDSKSTSSASSFTRRKDARFSMEIPRGKPASITSSSTQSIKDDNTNPFVFRHGRRYLKGTDYPLPSDLPELQRQNLYTLLATSILGKPLLSPAVTKKPPQKVLEIACGSGYWSSLVHDYLAELGCLNISFTGLDIVNVAPDLRKQGIDWRFVQHDLRSGPLPFDDEEFDLVLLKDLSLVVPLGLPSESILDESIRVLRPEGSIELWESDHIIRHLIQNPPDPPGKQADAIEVAISTGSYLISAATPFVTIKNPYLRDANNWIEEALDRRKLSPTPCTRMQSVLIQETDSLEDIGSRRVAIPFEELRWEQDNPVRAAYKRRSSRGSASAAKVKDKAGNENDHSVLTEDQAAFRYTALLVVIQMFESLEPLLKEVSGKNQEEWQRWWSWMMTDLLENKGASNGCCLEIGVWWAKKIKA